MGTVWYAALNILLTLFIIQCSGLSKLHLVYLVQSFPCKFYHLREYNVQYSVFDFKYVDDGLFVLQKLE